jgi:small GTP-binding protein
MIKIKAILVGESQTGKTCILNKLVSNIFIENPGSTNVAENLEKEFTVEGKTITLDIWDTAGQEKFRSLNKIFFKEAEIAFLVYDITKKQTFDELKNFWVEQVRTFSGENVLFAIVGNKADLYTKEEVNENMGQEFADQINGVFAQTSAKHGTGINDLFQTVVEKKIASNPELKDKLLGVKLEKPKKRKGECCGGKRKDKKILVSD